MKKRIILLLSILTITAVTKTEDVNMLISEGDHAAHSAQIATTPYNKQRYMSQASSYYNQALQEAQSQGLSTDEIVKRMNQLS